MRAASQATNQSFGACVSAFSKQYSALRSPRDSRTSPLASQTYAVSPRSAIEASEKAKASWRSPPRPKATALGRGGDLQEALAFSDASIEERGDTAYVWLARGDVLLSRGERRAEYCFEKALTQAPKD